MGKGGDRLGGSGLAGLCVGGMYLVCLPPAAPFPSLPPPPPRVEENQFQLGREQPKTLARAESLLFFCSFILDRFLQNRHEDVALCVKREEIER